MNQRQRLLEQIRQQSIQKRAQALKEAAQRQANNAPIVAAAAGAAGGGGGSTQCPPSAGIGLYLEFPLGDDGDLFGVGLIPLDYLGQQDGRPSYGGSIVPGEFESRLQFDPESGQWRGDFINGPATFSTYSDQLVSSNWSEFNIPDIPIQVQQTTCGFPDLGRYCVTIPAFGIQAQPFPSWIGEPEGLPALWQLGVGIIIWGPALDPEAPEAWIVLIGGEGDVFIPGSQDQLPLGEFEIAPGVTIIIAEGACDF